MSANAKGDVKRYCENWQNEVDSADQYRFLASTEPNKDLATVFNSLADVEEKHIRFWENQIQKAGKKVGPRKPSVRSRILKFFAKHVNRQIMVSTIAAAEHADRNVYATQPETAATGMTSEERWHAKVLQEIVRDDPRGVEGRFLGKLEGRHKAASGNALRAAVLGANDGLCSNLSLVMGAAGAQFNSQALVLTGFAGLLAGAFSMALGEYISVTSARELAQREIRIESDELELDPESEQKELFLIYRAKGLSEKEAAEVSSTLLEDKSKALDTLTREELGINPKDLGGSAMEAALTSFILFAIGAIFPVIPFLISSGSTAIVSSIILSSVMLFAIGSLITIFTGRSVWISGSRQLILGLLAAGATYYIGKLIAGAVSI